MAERNDQDLDSLPPEYAPELYLERVSFATGQAVVEPIEPEELLIQSHRDVHPVDIHARYMMSRVVRRTGSERVAIRKMRRMRLLAQRLAMLVARLSRRDPDGLARRLFGLSHRDTFFRFKRLGRDRDDEAARRAALVEEAASQLAAARRDGGSGLRLLLTGGTGFVGKEILWQAAQDAEIVEVAVLIRPQEIRDRRTDEVLEVLSAEDRGEQLLRQLWLDDSPARAKFRFLAGDIEEPSFGLTPEAIAELARRITHVIHCAASVAFDDPYLDSFRANVVGTRHALGFSHALQSAPQSPFVAHLGVETSYIHGRQVQTVAREDALIFPRNYYNNYYELTKAIGSLETERTMLEEGLRVSQLCPTIVIGEARTGNNRGDTKVVNAPVNLFGRAAMAEASGGLSERSKVAMLTRLARVFPGDPSARINLITVDRVAAGILAAVKRPQAVGRRIHLANDELITAAEIAAIAREELDIEVKLVDPTLHRNVGLPLVNRLLESFGQKRIGGLLNKMNDVFGGYAEWGQPVHEVGNDVELLGLVAERPDPRRAFRMLCRHNRYVQEFGRLRDLDEISRREKLWRDFILAVEERTGRPVTDLSAGEFRALVERELRTRFTEVHETTR